MPHRVKRSRGCPEATGGSFGIGAPLEARPENNMTRTLVLLIFIAGALQAQSPEPGKTGGGTPLFLKWRGGEQEEANAVTKQVMLKLSKGFDVWGETIRDDKYSVTNFRNESTGTTDLQARDCNGAGVEAVSWAHAHQRRCRRIALRALGAGR